MLRPTQLLLWRAGAIVALALGLLGLALPVAPTVPFLILAAWAAGKGWPALERWLLAHSIYGPHIRNWRQRRAVPRKAKLFATAMMLVSAVGLEFTGAAVWLKAAAPLTMAAVAIWLWLRPEP
ncbi:MAG TPA: YbaN family protein [Steroidobacter sp.]|nr:YbaN family protein [Steroidobacter sp.]